MSQKQPAADAENTVCSNFYQSAIISFLWYIWMGKHGAEGQRQHTIFHHVSMLGFY